MFSLRSLYNGQSTDFEQQRSLAKIIRVTLGTVKIFSSVKGHFKNKDDSDETKKRLKICWVENDFLNAQKVNFHIALSNFMIKFAIFVVA